jgi:hypothetical protein
LGINVQAIPFVKNTGNVPTDKELKKLALDSLLLFNGAIQTKSFENFDDKISKLWQKEVTPEKLLEIFQSFIDQKINITPIAKLEPAFAGIPAVNKDGFLVIKGSYPTQPSKVFFELKYVYEDATLEAGSNKCTSEAGPRIRPARRTRKEDRRRRMTAVSF